MLFRRLRNAGHLLVRDVPLVFRRVLPTGDVARQVCGLWVEVRLHPDLRIFVMSLPEREIDLSGRFAFGDVRWDQGPTALFPLTAQGMIGADIRDMLRLFRIREIHPKAWTSRAEVLEQL